MKKTLFCLFLASQAYAVGGVQSSLTVSSGTYQSVDMYSNADGSNRQAVVLGDFSSSDTARVNQGQGLQVYLGTSSASGIGTLTGITNAISANASQTGTWTVQVGNTQNTIPIQVISTAAVITSTYSINTNVTNTVPVTGTFFQATQPVSFGAAQIATVTPGTGTVNMAGTVQPGNTQNTTSWQTISSNTVVTSTYSLNIAITNTPSVSQSGTWTVQPGNTQNTTGWIVVTTVPIPSGTNSIGTIQIGNTQNTTSVQVISTSTLVQGTAAAGAAASGNPLQDGVLASSNTPTFQTDTGSGVMSPMRGTRSGAVVTVLDCPREQIVKSSITITASTTETVILSSGAASVFNDLLELLALNTSATATRVDIRSGGGPTGTTIDFALYVPAGETRGFTTPHPWPQTSSASNWTAQSSVSVTDVRLYGIFCKSK